MWGCIICGIVGIIARKTGGLFQRDVELFEQALVINTIRGKDSVGAFTAFRNKQALAIKHGSNPFELFKTKEWNSFKNECVSRGKFVIGHNRASTRGATNTDNAHPFVEENIILVHNGTIYNQSELTTEKVEVDSNAIAHALVKNSPAEVFPTIMGAFACVWFDTTKQKLFMFRNDERPLCVIVTEESYLVSSEPWIMAAPAGRQQGRKIGDIFDITPGDLYAFDLDGKFTVEKVDMSKKAVRSVGAAQGQATTSAVSTTTGLKDSTTIEDSPFFEKGTPKSENASSEQAQELLRQMLVESRRKKIEKMRSTNCALTQRAEVEPTSTSTTEKDSISSLIELTEKDNLVKANRLSGEYLTNGQIYTGWAGPTRACHPTMEDRDTLVLSKNVVNTPLYPTGRVVLFRVLQNGAMANGLTRFTGNCMEPGMEMVDVQGFVPKDTMLLPATLCTGTIFFTKISVHGPEIHLVNVERCTFTKVHATEITAHLWTVAYRECECTECGRELTMYDKPFTDVKTKAVFNQTASGKPLNTITCICADCIQEKIPEGPYREQFIAKRKNYKAAGFNPQVMRSPTDPRPPIQNGEPVGTILVRGVDGIFGVQGQETLH